MIDEEGSLEFQSPNVRGSRWSRPCSTTAARPCSCFSPLTFGEVGGAARRGAGQHAVLMFQSPNVRGSRWSSGWRRSSSLPVMFQSPNVRGSRWSVQDACDFQVQLKFQSPNVRGSRWSWSGKSSRCWARCFSPLTFGEVGGARDQAGLEPIPRRFSPLTFGEVGGAWLQPRHGTLHPVFQSPNVRGSRWSHGPQRRKRGRPRCFSPLTFGEVGGARPISPKRSQPCRFQSPNVRGSRWSGLNIPYKLWAVVVSVP